MQTAIAHHQAGRVGEAEKIYRQVLAIDRRDVNALHLLGVIAQQAGQPALAIELIGQAIAIDSNFAVAYGNLGHSLLNVGRVDESLAACAKCVELDPDYAIGHVNLGNALQTKGRLDEAAAAYRTAIRLAPRSAEAHSNLGNVLKSQGMLDEAITELKSAIELQPKLAEAHHNLGIALSEKGEFDSAAASFVTAIRCNPNFAGGYVALGNALQFQGRPEEALAYFDRAVALRPDDSLLLSTRLYSLHFHPGFDASEIYQQHREWERRFGQPLRSQVPRHKNDRSPDRRLRVGYVSPDFRDHVVGRNLKPLLGEHNHSQFEIVCYGDVAKPDEMTKAFQYDADTWRNTAGVDHAQLADIIRNDGIDILVDCTLHMAGSRLPVFARKPAPVQVTFAGYPGTTGLSAIDYRFTDPYLDPPGGSNEYYSERSIRLPHSFWCYDAAAMAPPSGVHPPVGALRSPSQGFLTFGCLNNFAKANAGVLQLWAQLLETVKESRLLLLCPPGNARQWVLAEMLKHSIAADRIGFVPKLPRGRYLEVYHQIDIALDTLPYNGHTTSLDALWMGVPVVTLVGKTIVGRAGFSQLSNLGLTELVAETPEQYVTIAADLAGDVDRLKRLRAGLRDRMRNSPLMDAVQFTRDIESAYRRMWRTWCAA
jgi:predicted O-linked N-acetylglucosamine transferase (SPINDLY family)